MTLQPAVPDPLLDSHVSAAANGGAAPAVTSIPPGDIQFINCVVPTLDPGQYSMTVTQTLAYSGAPPVNPPQGFPPPAFDAGLAVTVGGAGLTLAPADIYSTSPPDRAEADFTEVLPHIVLATRTVPWEVQLGGAAATVPWLALLLFADGEIVQTQTVPLSQALQVPPKTLAPSVPASEAANVTTPVTVIDVTTGVFQTLVPRLSEVPFLTHCRQVNVADKEIGLSSGWFATVIANRFPSVPAGQTNARFTAHLVSLYGLDGYLADPPAPFPADTRTVRLLSLANWSFTCDPASGLDFRSLMANLGVPPAGTAVGDSSYLLLRLPLPPAAASEDAVHQTVRRVIQGGYVPAPYRMRQGDQVSGWYRGPLAPAPTPRLTLDPITLSGEAMVYDGASGLFDQSYAVAWETGRLLALSDRNFASSLLEWRGRGQQFLNQLYFNIQQNPALRGTMDQASNNANVQELRSLLEPDLLAADTFLPYIVSAFARSVGLSVPALASVPLPAAAGAPVPPVAPTLSAALGQLSEQPWVQSALADLTHDNLDAIVEWLARICLLYGVPFANLVPDPRMLPAESIRFFYVDQTYLDAMVDGAVSVGIHSSRDTEYNATMYHILRDAVDVEMSTLRAELLGMPPLATGVSGSMGGFLLRSAVVAGWPGLEVRAFQPATPAGAGAPLPALRIDRLAPDVLLAIFPSVPGRIELNEPQEGLRFGVEDDGIIELRNVSAAGTPGAPLGKRATVQYRTGAPAAKMLDVAATLADMSRAAPVLASIGPAAFAVQMVKSPEQMVFYGAGA